MDDAKLGMVVFFGILLLIVLSSGVGAFMTARRFKKSKWVYTLAGLGISAIIVAGIFVSVVIFDITVTENTWGDDSEAKAMIYVTAIVFGSILTLILLHRLVRKRLSVYSLRDEITEIGSTNSSQL